MTDLRDLSPAGSFGDLLSCSRQGSGLSGSPTDVTDGFGNPSAIALSTNELVITKDLKFPTVPGGFLYFPVWTADPPVPTQNGAAFFNSSDGKLKISLGGVWTVIGP